MTLLKPNSRLHFRSGSTLDVFQFPHDAARLLWGTDPGDDAHDMAFAALQNSAGTQRVNPQEVERIEEIS